MSYTELEHLVIFLLCQLLLLNPVGSKCQKPFQCGNFTMEFPFSDVKDPGCGLITVGDCDSEQPVIIPADGRFNQNYSILEMLPPNRLRIREPEIESLLRNRYCRFLRNLSLSRSPSLSFEFSSSNLTLFACNNQSNSDPIDELFRGYSRIEREITIVYYRTAAADTRTAGASFGVGCTVIQLPINSSRDDDDDLFDLLEPEFTLEWSVDAKCEECYDRGGQCLTNSRNEFLGKKEERFRRILLIGAATLAALASTAIIMIVVIRRKYTPLSYISLPMNTMPLSRNNSVFFFVRLFLLLLPILDPADSGCPKSFQCGNLTMEFPFTHVDDPDCGLILVDGCDTHHPRIPLESARWNNSYTILNMASPNTLEIRYTAQEQLQRNYCVVMGNASLSRSPSLSFALSGPNLTVFTCYNQSYSEPIEARFRDYRVEKCALSSVYYKIPATDGVPPVDGSFECPMIQLPMKHNAVEGDLFDLLAPEFTVEWNVSEDCYDCHRRGGQCLSNTRNEFLCKEGNIYPEGKEENTRIRRILLIGAVTLAALTSTAIIMIIVIRRKYTPQLRLFGFQKAKPGNEKDIELFLKNYGNLAPIRYTYSEIKKMTNSFRENLGKGGYGTVYKGKLQDGRIVAVKVLNESKENGEEFVNEVASISRTSHINIVTLLGFCFKGSKRALIYEFMPNGSLEKFIKNTGSSSEEVGLGWQVLLEIALGIARGLEYLHHSCNMRILHFDIKPHNILLDKNFNPRISDFGLAKLCPNRSGIVSMMAARGTIGYIAPEVFCKNFGEVSHKSDVYSYRMMVLEITGGRKKVDRAEVDHTSETYFPHYIYKQLEVNAERDGTFAGTMNEEESLAKRKLSIVGLWCIQTDPRDRPSMTKVVEMLEKLETLQVPPKPYLSSPPRSPPRSSSSESL